MSEMPQPTAVYGAIAIFSFSIGFLLGAWCGIGSEKTRIKKMEGAGRRLIEYYNKMKLPETTQIIDSDKKVPRFPPGPLAELYNEKDIEEVLTSVNKSFPDRMKAAKAAKRKV